MMMIIIYLRKKMISCLYRLPTSIEFQAVACGLSIDLGGSSFIGTFNRTLEKQSDLT